MFNNKSRLVELASEILDSEIRREPLESFLGVDSDVLTLEDAYLIQDSTVQFKINNGDRVIGLKVGATSPSAQAKLSVTEPVYGVLFESQLVEDKATILLSELIAPRIECEIAVLISEDVRGPVASISQFTRVISTVSASFDIVDSRISSRKLRASEVVADNCLAARFVLGTQKNVYYGTDLSTLDFTLMKNCEVIVEKNGEADLGDPLNSLEWLVNKLAVRGKSIKAGTYVLTGALTPQIQVTPGDHFEAIFDSLGSVAVTFI